MPRTAIPSTFPQEGIFEYSTIHVDLSCATPGAEIYYTIDGEDPAFDSPVYIRENGLLPLPASAGQEVTHTIRAFAKADGLEASRIVTFTYRIIGRRRGVFSHQIIRDAAAGTAAVIRIEDFDLDKMYLIIGTKRAVLIDAGWDQEGDLPGLCRELTGRDIPVDLVIAHGHPDHVAQLENFLKAGSTVYMPHADIETASSFCPEVSWDQVRDIKDGDILDLGSSQLNVYTIPGHTPGGVVLLDKKTGDLFSSDEFGSNRRYVPDSAWLQIGSYSLESCLKTLERFLNENRGKLKRIFTGHNDEILDAQAYLESLRRALKKGVVNGNAGLSPSLRSAAESFGSGTAVIDGEWRIDPIWSAANVKFLYDRDAQADPPRYAQGYQPGTKTTLSN